MKNLLRYTVLISLLLTAGLAHGQGKIKIDSADVLRGERDAAGNSYRKLIGNVQLVQGATRIFGDSVIYYQDRNFTEVFGDTVRIEEGDTIVITGGRLRYDGDKQLAEMRDNVIYLYPST